VSPSKDGEVTYCQFHCVYAADMMQTELF